MLTALSAALVYGLTGGLAPGPLLTLVVSQTLRHGAREGMKTSLAPLITDGPITVLLLLFLDRIAAIRPLLGGIAIAGVAFLLYLARESWSAPPPSAVETAAAPRSLVRSALVNFLNPSPYLFWLTAGTPMMRTLAVLLVVFAAIVARDAIALLTTA